MGEKIISNAFKSTMNNQEQSDREYKEAPNRVGRYLADLDIKGKTIVDFGCGWGGETLYLSEQGFGRVYGVDINEEALNQARSFAGRSATFLHGTKEIPSGTVDYVFSTHVFEHVFNMNEVLVELYRILKHGGHVHSIFGPLFYSPYGCHFYWAGLFPWSHLIMGRRWLLKRIASVRRDPFKDQSWDELGLNRITFEMFSAHVIQSAFDVEILKPLPVRGLTFATRLPVFKKYLTGGIHVKIRKQ